MPTEFNAWTRSVVAHQRQPNIDAFIERTKAR